MPTTSSIAARISWLMLPRMAGLSGRAYGSLVYIALPAAGAAPRRQNPSIGQGAGYRPGIVSSPMPATRWVCQAAMARRQARLDSMPTVHSRRLVP